MGWLKKVVERKFLMAVASSIAAFAASKSGIPATDILAILTPIVTWITTEAVVDAVKTFKNPPVGPNPDDIAAGYVDPATPKSKPVPK